MRKIALVFLMVFCAIGLFALDGTVISVTGKVEMQAVPDGEWVVLKAGDTVPEGAVISTAFKSSASLKLGGSTVTVNQLTRVVVRELTNDSDKVTTKLFLDAGALRADVKSMDNKANDFKIQSSVVTSSVRGTELQDNALGEHITLRGNVSTSSAECEWGVTTTQGEQTELYDGVLKNSYTNGNKDVNIAKAVTSPVEEDSSPLQITTGDYGDGVVHLPPVGFADAAGAGSYEKELYTSNVSIGLE
ncbi:MAG: FecR domain-containing protein [Spirochaetales bacterium]|nr:FecR domain-containing protein [Spirochaetales bacterium]